MKKQINPTRIGIFIVGAIVLTIAAVIVFGSGHFFTQKERYVAFFEGSVFGLNPGAPVVCRGVKIGTVTDIRLLSNEEEKTIYIAVLFEIQPRKFHVTGKKVLFENANDRLDELIDFGLRVHLEQQSFLTRQMMLVLDFNPDTPVKLVGIETGYPEIPTIKTGLQALMETVEKLPLQEIVNSMRDALKGIEEAVHSPEIAESLKALKGTLQASEELVEKANREFGPLAKELNGTLADGRRLLNSLDGKVDPLATSLEETLEASRITAVRAGEAVASIENTTREDSPLIHEMTTALAEMTEAFRSLRILAEYIEQHPESILRGKVDESGGK